MGMRQDASTGSEPAYNDSWKEAKRRHHLALRGLAEAPSGRWPGAGDKKARDTSGQYQQKQPAND